MLPRNALAHTKIVNIKGSAEDFWRSGQMF
jgi:hypothetical protein